MTYGYPDDVTDTLSLNNKKYIYRALITGLQLGLAANLTVTASTSILGREKAKPCQDCFNQSVQKIRWYLLSRIHLPARLVMFAAVEVS